MRIGFLQINTLFGEKEFNLQKAIDFIQRSDLDLLVLPEFFATGYQFTSEKEVEELSEKIPEGLTTKTLEEVARKKNMFIVAGLPEEDQGRFYNSAVIVGPEGYIGLYRKTHLFFEEKLFFSPGNTGFRVWNTDLGKIGIMICFDWFFPEAMRTLALSGAQIIAHPANLVLPYCPNSMPLRCLENRVFAITANRIGIEERGGKEPLRFIGQSEVVAPDSSILIRASSDKEELLFVEIDPAKALNKSINEFNDLFRDRRPEMYNL